MANLTGFGSMQPTRHGGGMQQQQQVMLDPATGYAKDVRVAILEQPAENKLRFRSVTILRTRLQCQNRIFYLICEW